MADIKIVLNREGVRQILKDEKIAQVCRDIANKTASRCGEGYEVQDRNYPERTGAAVLAVTYQAKRDNSENQTLLKALGVG